VGTSRWLDQTADSGGCLFSVAWSVELAPFEPLVTASPWPRGRNIGAVRPGQLKRLVDVEYG